MAVQKTSRPRGAKAARTTKAKAHGSTGATKEGGAARAQEALRDEAAPSRRDLAQVLGGEAQASALPSQAPSARAPSARSLLQTRLQAPADRALAADAAKVAALVPQMLCDLGGVDDLSKLGVRPLVASAGKESLFNCLFGRDSIRMAVDVLDSYPAVAKATVLELSKLQGTKTNPKSEEEPGRIIHEYRDPDELKEILKYNAGITNWEFPYYGSVDATPMYVSLVAELVRKEGPAILAQDVNVDASTRARFGAGPRTVRDCVEAAVRWIEGRLEDPRAGGFLYVQRANPHGIENQILEDSRDSVYYEDGRLHPTTLPYAPIAEQGYVYKALMDAAFLLEALPASDARGSRRSSKAPSLEPEALRARAKDLQQRVVRDFWQDDLSTFAQAIGFDEKGRGTPMRTVASSPGQLLRTGILDDLPELRARLVERLFEPDLLAGAGIRTKSTTAARFLPGGYHNGTVWPTISLEIKDGLLRSASLAEEKAAEARARGEVLAAESFSKEAEHLLARATDLEDRAIRACAKFPFFPEFLRGDPDGSIAVNTEVKKGIDRDGLENTFEQPPQPQGWTTTALEKILRRRGFLEAPPTDQAA